ncbi:MAG: hypothetical protein WD844_01665 [Thermoleophilaceae bacterium]
MAGRLSASLVLAVCGLIAAAAPAAAQVPGVLDCDELDPSHCLYPFPNDRFTVADATTDTGRRVNLPLLGMPRNIVGKPVNPRDMNRSDGFSPGSLIITKVPGLDNQAAFEQTGAVPITDMARSLDPGQPVVVIDAGTGERHLIWSEIDANPADPADRTLLIRPGVNFEEGHRYIVALRDLRDAAGNTLEARAPFRAWRDNPAPNAGGRRGHMEDLFGTLGEAGIERESLYLAWDFTVASERSLTERMLHIRDDAFAQLGDTDLADLQVEGRAPAYTVDAVTDYTPEQDARIARRIEGTFQVPCYLAAGLTCVTGTRFRYGADGKPLRLTENSVEANYICHVPRSASAASPARPSLYGHGLLGSAGEIGQSQLKSLGNDHNFVFCATDWDGMSEEDLPNVVTILLDLSRFSTLADRVQQGMLNQLFLGRLMIHPDGFSRAAVFQDGGQSVIDTERLFYDGNSQGGIIGGALTAVAPDFQHAVLGVPGMNYSTLLRRSVDFVGDDMLTVAMNGGEGFGYSSLMYTAYPDELERPLTLALIQMLWDRAEANGYAHHMTDDPLPNTPEHRVLMHVAFGDHQVADVSAEVEARTIGARMLHKPMLDAGRHSSVDPFYAIEAIPAFPYGGSALVVWDSGTPTPPTTNTPPRAGDDPHEFPRRQPAAREQKSAFLQIGGQIIDVCGGGPCYAPPG